MRARGDIPVRSIDSALSGHRNSLGLIRLILAALVIFDHAFPLGGFGKDPVLALTRDQASLGSLAVAGFFAISGYLIAKSGAGADVLQFMWRRFLRIFPAYWTVLIVGAVVVGPIVWVLSGASIERYLGLGPGGPVWYFLGNWTLTIGQYGIHDIFAETTPYGQAVGASVLNGSLWTLSYEWACYLIIAVFVAAGVLLRARILIPIATALLVAAQVWHDIDPAGIAAAVPVLADPYTVSLTLTFMLGSTVAMYAKQVPFADGLGILSFAVLAGSLAIGGFGIVGIAAGVYFILYLGARLPEFFHRVGAKNDYSYGVYIYGFLTQQVLAFFGVHRLGYLPFALLALVISFGLAWLSWHGVEKRAMSLKNWGPGRGIRYWAARAQSRLGRTRSDTRKEDS